MAGDSSHITPPDLQAISDWTWWLLYDNLWKIILPGLCISLTAAVSAGITITTPTLLEANLSWKIRMFRAGAIANRKKLIEMDFFAVDNPQKYCCEGVVGSHQEQAKIVDEAFTTIMIFLGVLVMYVMICTCYSFTEDWVFAIFFIFSTLVLNYLILQLLNVSWARNLKLKNEELAKLDQKIKILQNGGILQPSELQPQKNRRNRVVVEATIDLERMSDKEKEAMRKSQLAGLLRRQTLKLHGYPRGLLESEGSSPRFFSAFALLLPATGVLLWTGVRVCGPLLVWGMGSGEGVLRLVGN